MHVTLVSGIDPGAPTGGTRSYVFGLAERLRGRDVGVALITRDGHGAPPTGIAHTPIRSGPTSARFLVRLIAAASRLPIPEDSILHVQRPDDLLAFTLTRRRNPAVCTLHGIPALGVRRRKGPGYGLLYRVLERAGLRRASRVIAVDAVTARWFARRYPRLAGRTDVIPVAVDTNRFRPLDRQAARERFGVRARIAFLYAGRLTVEKRVDAIVRALRHVPDAELLIAGEGPEGARLRTLARGAPVRFLGAVPHEKMPQLLNAMDALVLPSEYEGLATVVLEALACGIPVVATPVGDVPRVVVPGKTGWLVSDPADLGPALAEAASGRGEMAAACVAAARPYSWDVVVDRVLAVYREAVAT